MIREEVDEKAHSLAAYRSAASPAEVDRLVERARNLHRDPDLRDLLPPVTL